MGNKLFLSIGEAMVELSQAEGGLWRMGFAGDTLNTAWYARACLSADWEVAYFTRLGHDPFSERMQEFLQDSAISTRFIERDPERTVGLYAIELHDGERSFSYWRGQSAARRLAD
ncbi:MAG: sugar kinase, partial [Rhizobium sp.]|nr:sugar kinase [Rhizobium sp.]